MSTPSNSLCMYLYIRITLWKRLLFSSLSKLSCVNLPLLDCTISVFSFFYYVRLYTPCYIKILSQPSICSTCSLLVYIQGVPKTCIHTLNNYNSLKLSFECHAFVSNLEMRSFISSKMEHLPTTIVMWEPILTKICRTDELGEEVALNSPHVHQTSHFWTFFYGDTLKVRFIEQNLQQLLSWEQQLKENSAKYQMKLSWFVMFAIPSLRVVSSAWTRTFINSNTCDNSKNSTLVFFNLDYKT